MLCRADCGLRDKVVARDGVREPADYVRGKALIFVINRRGTQIP